MKTDLKISILLATSLGLAACSDGPYEPILDGPKSVQFQSDLSACRQVSLQREKTKRGATGGAIVGGLLGGAEAEDGDELEGVVAGAVLGGLIGSAEEGADVEEQREKIVFHCLRGRGHNVVG